MSRSWKGARGSKRMVFGVEVHASDVEPAWRALGVPALSGQCTEQRPLVRTTPSAAPGSFELGLSGRFHSHASRPYTHGQGHGR